MHFPTWSQLKAVIFDRKPTETPLTPESAKKICGITDPQNIAKSEKQFLSCAQNLRKEAEYYQAKSILNSLVFYSEDKKIQTEAREARIDEMGEGGNFSNFLFSIVGLEPRRKMSDEGCAKAWVQGAAKGLGILYPSVSLYTSVVEHSDLIEKKLGIPNPNPYLDYDHDFNHRDAFQARPGRIDPFLEKSGMIEGK